MKVLNYTPAELVIGRGSLEYLRGVKGDRVFIVTGGQSMKKYGVIDRITQYLTRDGRTVERFDGIGKNPTIDEVRAGAAAMERVKPDTIIAVGGGSAMDAAKAMMIFYEAPDLSFEDILRTDKVPARRRKSQLICISSTSGTGSEVTRAAVVTDTATHIKEPIIRPICRADVAILDADLTMTMPPHVIAETGMDALTHAVEAYTNHALDDFNEVWAKGAIEGIMKWLPVSYTDNTIEAHEKIHNYQAMAGFAFTNVGLGAVHGIAHSIGGAYNTGHGLANGVILPYILDYNRKDAAVAQKLAYLSRLLGFGDIVAEIKTLKAAVGIPLALKGAGIAEDDYKKDLPVLIEHAMLGATQVNPRPVTKADMERLLHAAYYGVDVDF